MIKRRQKALLVVNFASDANVEEISVFGGDKTPVDILSALA